MTVPVMLAMRLWPDAASVLGIGWAALGIGMGCLLLWTRGRPSR